MNRTISFNSSQSTPSTGGRTRTEENLDTSENKRVNKVPSEEISCSFIDTVAMKNLIMGFISQSLIGCRYLLTFYYN